MKSPIDQLYAAVALLEERGCLYAVAGGIAASIYRSEPRATFDIDFLIMAEANSLIGSEKLAGEVIEGLLLSPALIKEHQLSRKPAMNKKSKPNVIVVGRDRKHPEAIGVDFLLPSLPWVGDALTRAAYNRIDFGRGKVPTITVEDLIIAKLFAGRAKDIDDLEDIFKAKHKLDLPYLAAKIQNLKLYLPVELKKLVPKAIRVAARQSR